MPEGVRDKSSTVQTPSPRPLAILPMTASASTHGRTIPRAKPRPEPPKGPGRTHPPSGPFPSIGGCSRAGNCRSNQEAPGESMSNQATADSTAEELEVVAATVEALARALELHDYRRGRFGETASHTARVTQLALLLTEQIAPELLLDPQLAYGFRLHDIGMIGVSNSTLLKPGALDVGRARRGARAPVARRADRRSGSRARRHHPPGDRVPPRALGRIRLSARPARDGDPAGGADLRSRRRLRRDHERPAVPRRAAARGAPATRSTRRPVSTSTRTSSRRSSHSSCRQSRTSRTSRTASDFGLAKRGRSRLLPVARPAVTPTPSAPRAFEVAGDCGGRE